MMKKELDPIMVIIKMNDIYNKLSAEEKDVEIYEKHLIDELNKVCNQHIKTLPPIKSLYLNPDYEFSETLRIKDSLKNQIDKILRKRFMKYKASEIESIDLDKTIDNSQKRDFKKIVTDTFKILYDKMNLAVKMLEDEISEDEKSHSCNKSRDCTQEELDIMKNTLRKMKENLEKKYQDMIFITPNANIVKTKKLSPKNDAKIVAKTLMDNFQELSYLITISDADALAKSFISAFNKNIENVILN